MNQQQAATSANEEQSLKQNELTGEPSIQETECQPPSNNLNSDISNITTPQSPLQQQQRQQDVAINIDERFGPSCAPVLSDTEIVNNIIAESKSADCRHWLYLFIGCIPTLIISVIAWIAWAAINYSFDPSTSQFFYILGIVSASLTGLIFIWAFFYGVMNYSNGDRYITLRSNVRCVVKLEGNQWTNYVNYMYGPDRTGFTYLGVVGGCTFCCCRKPHYEKLIARGYGYIVFCQQGLILDEMYHIVRNRPHIVLSVKLIIGIGLRVYLIRSDGKYTVQNYWGEERRREAALEAIQQQTVPLDIYLPSTLSVHALALLGLQVQHGL